MCQLPSIVSTPPAYFLCKILNHARFLCVRFLRFPNIGTRAGPKKAGCVTHRDGKRKRVLAHIMEHTIVSEKTGQESENTRDGHEVGTEVKFSIGRDETRCRVEAEAEFETGEDEDVDNIPVIHISPLSHW